MEKNVLQFLDVCSKEVGKYEEEGFSQWGFRECLDLKITSPIEQILYIAVNAICKLNGIHMCDGPVTIEDKEYFVGFAISPQHKIGKYRVDFIAACYKYPSDGKQESKVVIIECDSQEFHERSEKERRYEKARDRFFILNEYKAFHFTGSEIVNEPFRVAKEIVSYVAGLKIDFLLSSIDEL